MYVSCENHYVNAVKRRFAEMGPRDLEQHDKNDNLDYGVASQNK